jgi:capsular polysaccharide biosynthesis protein
MARVVTFADRYRNNTMRENSNTIINEKGETEIDLIELMRQLLAHIRLILFVTILCTAIAGLYTFYYITPIYESTAKLYVLSSGDSAINLSDLQIGAYLANDYIEVFKTWEVHEMVINNLGLPYTYAHMQGMLTITNPSNTRILYITVKSPDAHEAMEIANEYASVAIQFISQTMSTDKPNIMSKALEPAYPTTPSKTRNILIGFMLGLLISVGIITLRYIMDDKIKTMDDIRKYSNLSVLAVVPKLERTQINSSEKQRGKQ